MTHASPATKIAGHACPRSGWLGRCLAAALVVLAACGGGGDSGPPAVPGPVSATLELTGTEFAYAPDAIAVSAGAVPVVLHNAGKVVHDLRIEGKPTFLLEAAPGQTGSTTWTLAAGRYRLYCSIPGHRAAGMVGVLEVRPA